MIRAGRYRHLGVIEQPTETRDAVGGVVQSWATSEPGRIYATRRMAIDPIRPGSREFWDARQYNVVVTHVISMHYTPGITPKMRVSARGRTFGIEFVTNPEELDRETVLYTKERQ